MIAGLGGLHIMYMFIPAGAMYMKEIYKMLPYVITIIVLIVSKRLF